MLKLLCSAPRWIWLDCASLSEKTFDEMREVWAEISVFGADALNRHFGASTYEWWNGNIEGEPRWPLGQLQEVHRLALAVCAIVCVFGVILLFAVMVDVADGHASVGEVTAFVKFSVVLPVGVQLVFAVVGVVILQTVRVIRRWTQTAREFLRERLNRSRNRFVKFSLAKWRSLPENTRLLLAILLLAGVGIGMWLVITSFATSEG